MSIRAQADPAAELRKLGGARLILATAPDAKSMSALVGGLSPTRKLLVVGVPTDPLSVSAMHLVMAKNLGPRLAFGQRHRLGGHSQLQRADWRSADDREVSALAAQ